jgi:hypothetical protein
LFHARRQQGRLGQLDFIGGAGFDIRGSRLVGLELHESSLHPVAEFGWIIANPLLDHECFAAKPLLVGQLPSLPVISFL